MRMGSIFIAVRNAMTGRIYTLLALTIFAVFQLQAQDKDKLELMRMADEETAKIEQSGKVSKDMLLNEYINGLGQRLVPKDAPAGLRFSFKVIEDPTLNAFALPNGAIYVHSGILARLENEAQLAAILGHEITHVIKEHSFKGMQHKKKVGMFGGVIGGVLGGAAAPLIPNIPLSPLQGQILNYGGKLVVLASINGYDRNLEDEADLVGVRLMYEAGLDPREALKPFELLLKTYGDESKIENFFYGNHSRNQDRINNINKLLEKEYKAKLEGKELTINSSEFRRRTRVLVRDNAVLDYKLKRYQLAKEGLERALQVAPNDYIAHYHLGNVYRESGRTDQDIDRAIAEYKKAAEAKADYAPAYRELGMTCYRKQNYQEAIAAFQKYLELEPGVSDREQIERYIEELKAY